MVFTPGGRFLPGIWLVFTREDRFFAGFGGFYSWRKILPGIGGFYSWRKDFFQVE